MLSRCELERAAGLLDAQLAGGHLDRIVQRDAFRLELVVSERPGPAGGRARRHLVLSCDPVHARIGEATELAPAPASPLAFAQLLRARIGRARIEGVSLAPGERQLALRLASSEGAHALVLQILGPRSNAYLLDGDGVILGSLRPLIETRRDLALGAPLLPPETAPPPPGEDRFRDAPDEVFLRAIESRYAALERERVSQRLARHVGRAVERERQRLVRREASLRSDLASVRPAEEHRRLGELLKTGLHAVRPGASEVTLRDLATGQDVVVPLDPALGAVKNLEKLFAVYQRAQRREAAAAEQAASLEAQRAALATLRAEFDRLAGHAPAEPERLARFAARSDVARLLARHPLPGEGPRPRPARTPRRGGTPQRLRPGRYRTSDGLEVWVGRSAAGNDHLTTRLARGGDLFLHVEACPGSHVVLRMAGRKDVPQESLLEAAELAVHFSKQRGASRATLHVAPVKDVRKPRGAKPGLVHVLRGRSLALRRDAARLARVLGARIEDAE
jgi:predicted ribosome quality control (RQC) complex YloA/Tae2 family protein